MELGELKKILNELSEEWDKVEVLVNYNNGQKLYAPASGIWSTTSINSHDILGFDIPIGERVIIIN